MLTAAVCSSAQCSYRSRIYHVASKLFVTLLFVTFLWAVSPLSSLRYATAYRHGSCTNKHDRIRDDSSRLEKREWKNQFVSIRYGHNTDKAFWVYFAAVTIRELRSHSGNKQAVPLNRPIVTSTHAHGTWSGCVSKLPTWIGLAKTLKESKSTEPIKQSDLSLSSYANSDRKGRWFPYAGCMVGFIVKIFKQDGNYAWFQETD